MIFLIKNQKICGIVELQVCDISYQEFLKISDICY